MKIKARHLPSEDSSCGWLEPLTAPPAAKVLRGTQTCDFVVIGAGFTGLAAARRLAETVPGQRILLIDAGRAGGGASGRSSGFVVDLAGFVASMPEEHSQRFIRLSRSGIDELYRLVMEHQIDCDWDDRGFLHVAAGEAGRQSLISLQSWLDGRGDVYEWHEAAALKDIMGTSFYQAGIRLPGSILVQAGALVRGLAAALPEPVELYEDSPVCSIERRGRSGQETYRIATEGGEVVAKRVILALNGYASGFGVLSGVIPLVTFGSFTRQLTQSEQQRLGGEREWGALAQDPMGSSVRRTRDQRLLIRNHVHFDRRLKIDSAQSEKARRLHRQAFQKRFPELDSIEMEYTWSGVMGVTANRYSFFGDLGPGLVASGGFTGAGIAMGTVSGRLLADLTTGRSSDLLNDRQALPGPRWLPPEPFLSLGFPFYVARMNASAGETL